ncbi:DNA (cytosine-5)-methyltransferase CMT3-like [Beta vulgaris subsp. vulgaris]|uniref:DNA (cytosine-5)-methyltransferase CMT3-like n=1 Tax=Beta vulgaris subsp. vulgaris TaxID=3555 RepID=UPI002037544D|nr:DNA (cytosine-5)-methyltransferase CMT3-like [Beta vulgaris subsp. vulgaris]
MVACVGCLIKGIVVFMDIVEFLKPTYILMENVVDILRLADAQLGKYAIGNIKQVLELWLLVATAFHNSVFVFSYGEFILMSTIMALLQPLKITLMNSKRCMDYIVRDQLKE